MTRITNFIIRLACAVPAVAAVLRPSRPSQLPPDYQIHGIDGKVFFRHGTEAVWTHALNLGDAVRRLHTGGER